MKYAGVVVSAAIDNQRPPIKKANTSVTENTFPNLKKTRFVGVDRVPKKRRTRSSVYPDTSRLYRQQPNRIEKHGTNDSKNPFTALYQQILAQEVDRGIAAELIEEIKRIPGSQELVANGDLSSHITSILEDMGIAIDANMFVKGQPKIMAFVGPTGVGKTATIAKLAALQASRNGKRVALITLDNYGISAIALLKTYAEIIGIPLEAAVNWTELKRTLKQYKDQDLILIDTPGIGPKNQNQIQELKTYFEKIADLQIHLVLSATTKEKDLITLAEVFQEIDYSRLLFTKIDESGAFGNIVNLLIRSHIPLSFLCSGRKVPDDIEAGSIRKLVDILIQSKNICRPQLKQSLISSDVDHPGDDDQIVHRPYYVANKTSDVYHLPECKWSRKIKSDNILKFNNWLEADEQNFLPCRSCNPDRFQSVNRTDSKSEKRKFSGKR
ncbi:MAG: hypothetical protein HKO68_05625 [Desulfobacterales bacterium]|nr:hypothetical protein [Desulfobacterales bacterium]